MRTTLVVMAALVGCGDDGVNKLPDAPVVPVDAPASGSCSAAQDTCTGESICDLATSACVAAFPRVYQVRNIVVMLPPTDPDGAAWDAPDGDPDILVTISVNGAVVATTPTIDDVLSATFAGPFDVSLTAGATLLVLALDEDSPSNASAVRCNANPITAAQLRSRQFTCAATSARGSLSYAITAK